MSDDLVISTKGLGKRYRLGELQAYKTLRDGMTQAMRKSFTRFARRRARAPGAPKGHEHIWAIKDISLEIRRGEAVGIIGGNGAGKSTLLKILSRITEPTEGSGLVKGRVGSLLEVGTGFHPELTGRENIFLNGAILGMPRTEIRRQFDAIVAFAEVERFVDTPVKHYSSGMYMRLAFAVAAHLEPDILMVDEVLAVGDVAFQKKCLGRMNEVAGAGRTVLFVSHNMAAVSDLCGRCVRLADGRVVADGTPATVVPQYMAQKAEEGGSVDLRGWNKDRLGEGPMRVVYLCTKDADGEIRQTFEYGEPIVFGLRIEGEAPEGCILGVSIYDALGRFVLQLANTDDRCTLAWAGASVAIEVRLPSTVFNDGTYYVSVWLGDKFSMLNDRVGNSLSFQVDSSLQGPHRCLSAIRLPASWSVTHEN